MPDPALQPRAFRVAYDGRPYAGFQRQPDVPTVEGALFTALQDLGICDGDPPGYSAAGRTDAGTSALGQTIALSSPDWLTPRAFNGELPEAIRVWASAEVDEGFHATHTPTARTYDYHLHSPATDTDDASVQTTVERLSGEHDFHNLTPDTTGTVRQIDLSATRDGDFLVVRATAGGFPRHLVRKIAGLLGAIGRGAADADRVDRVLGPEPIDGPAGVSAAPARGLLLRSVTYPSVTFDVDSRAVADARSIFADRRVVHATRERVAGELVGGLTDAEGK